VKKVITASEMRAIDRLTTERYALPSLLLMENAAMSAARIIAARFPAGLRGKTALILCGPGNNGGDGAALARHLCLRGATVEAVFIGARKKAAGDADANFTALVKLALEAENDGPLFARSEGGLRLVECPDVASWELFAFQDLAHSAIDVAVDALFGTGLTRPLTGLYAAVAGYLQEAREFRRQLRSRAPLFVSLDLPSGLDADLSAPIGPTVKADLTITFTAPKPANVLPPAAEYNGELVVADIGSPLRLINEADSQLFVTEQEDAQAWLDATRLSAESYKHKRGHALIVAGSRRYAGAAALCAQAAMRSGAGLVTVATPLSAQARVVTRTGAEIMTRGLAETKEGAFSLKALEQINELAEKAHVIALGPGLTAHEDGTKRLARSLATNRKLPLVIDADGLNALAPWTPDVAGAPGLPLILTPHSGEFKRMLGTDDNAVFDDRVSAARSFAQQFHAILVLKGSRTLIAGPDGRVFINPTGNPGLGTAGAGDTLTGIIAACHAQAAANEDYDPLLTTVAAVYIAGLAGDLAAQTHGMRTFTASDVTAHLAVAMQSLDSAGGRP
jgi:NAD(P)H-hydrate epimerase